MTHLFRSHTHLPSARRKSLTNVQYLHTFFTPRSSLQTRKYCYASEHLAPSNSTRKPHMQHFSQHAAITTGGKSRTFCRPPHPLSGFTTTRIAPSSRSLPTQKIISANCNTSQSRGAVQQELQLSLQLFESLCYSLGDGYIGAAEATNNAAVQRRKVLQVSAPLDQLLRAFVRQRAHRVHRVVRLCQADFPQVHC